MLSPSDEKFLSTFIDYAITVFPISPPLSPLLSTTQNLQHPPTPLSSCPWVVHISSLSSLFPIPFFFYLSPLNNLLLVVRGGKGFLPTSLSWPEFSKIFILFFITTYLYFLFGIDLIFPLIL